MTELERVRAEFEQYMAAAHKAGVVFSVGDDGVVRAEYDPAAAKCVASWDADGELEQPMPDKANEQLPSSSDTAGTEAAGQTVAGSPALASGKPEWTPGPWAAYDRGIGWEVVVPDLRFGTRRLNDGHRETFTEADARLVAAAPDLYEALEELLLGVEEHSSAVQRRFLESAVNKTCLALAKAKGGA